MFKDCKYLITVLTVQVSFVLPWIAEGHDDTVERVALHPVTPIIYANTVYQH